MEEANLKFCQWEITTKCDLGCEGCNVPLAKNPEIPLEIVLKGIDDLAEAGIEHLEFIGGEPCLREDLPEILAYLNQKKEIKRFAVLTNGLKTEMLKKIAPHLSKEKGGLVLSINYTEEQCTDLLFFCVVDVAMAKKSFMGWKILEEYSSKCWIRANCVINRINISTFPEIAETVILKGAKFSFCPLVYRRQGKFKSALNLTFRSQIIGLAPFKEDKQRMEKSISAMKKLKEEFPDKIVPDTDYIEFMSKICKDPFQKYPLDCKGLGLPYLRISSLFGKSYHSNIIAPRLRACSDILGKNFSRFTTADLLNSDIKNRLGDFYQNDSEVKECCKKEGCPWSVTYALKNQKAEDKIII